MSAVEVLKRLVSDLGSRDTLDPQWETSITPPPAPLPTTVDGFDQVLFVLFRSKHRCIFGAAWHQRDAISNSMQLAHLGPAVK